VAVGSRTEGEGERTVASTSARPLEERGGREPAVEADREDGRHGKREL
jgi:hypothetical protein